MLHGKTTLPLTPVQSEDGRVAPAPIGASETPAQITLSDIFGAIKRRKWTVILTTVLALTAAVAFVRTATPLYDADIVLVLETREKSVVSLDSVVSGLSGDDQVVNTELAVLRSRNLLGSVVTELNLIEDPEFNPELQEPGLRMQIMSALGLVSPPTRKPDPVAVAVEILLDKLVVSVQPNSLAFTIRVTSEDPEKSALIANKIGQTYIDDQRAIKFEETARATEWLSEQVLQLKDELEAAEAAVEEYSLSSNLISEEALAVMSRQVKDLRERLQDLKNQRAEEARPIELGRALLADPTNEALALELGSPEALRIARELARLPQEAPERAGLMRRLEIEVGQIAESTERGLVRLDSQIATIETSLAQQTAEIDSQSADLVKLRQLTREAEAAGIIYEYFLTRMKETSVQQGISEADARIVSSAVVPLRPVFPRMGLSLALALVGGLVVGSGIALVRWQLDTRFRSPEELEEFTGARVFGAIPLVKFRRRNRILRYLLEKPSSAMAEAVRDVRTSILMADPDHPPQVILVSSAAPGDGKTTACALMANINAMLGKKVLIIEGDLRRPTMPVAFEIKPESGIADLMDGKKTLEEALWTHEPSGIDVLFAQDPGVNPSDLFDSRAFAHLLREMRARYELIFIDAPPVLAVPDARILARNADALVVCAAYRKSTRAMIRGVMRQFSAIRIGIMGFVMTKFDPAQAAREGYGEYGSYYGNVGKSYHRN